MTHFQDRYPTVPLVIERRGKSEYRCLECGEPIRPKVRHTSEWVQTRPRARYAHDPELGKVRFCPRCDEWWPFDREFWHQNGRSGYQCRACRGERRRMAA